LESDARARRRAQLPFSAQCLHALLHATEAHAAPDRGRIETLAVIVDGQQQRSAGFQRHVDARGEGMLGHVGQRFLHDAVEMDLLVCIEGMQVAAAAQAAEQVAVVAVPFVHHVFQCGHQTQFVQHAGTQAYPNFAELFGNTDTNGLTTERVIADPGQRYLSYSGELKLTRRFNDGPRLHQVHAMLRSRDFTSRYGGAAPALVIGTRPLGQTQPVPEPATHAFTPRIEDTVQQTAVGLAYELRWSSKGEFNVGVQQVDYRKTIQLPAATQPTRSTDAPWLGNAALALYLTPTLALYGSHTRGLEESGLAPNNALNRNEALPAIRTQQSDAGLRWQLNANYRVVAGVFDVRKPYFNTDEQNRFTILGDVQHRGMELSISATPNEQLNLLLGALWMQPRVTGAAVTLGRVGERPLGQPEWNLRANLDYRPAALPGWSFDIALSAFDERPSSRDNRVWLPRYTLLDLGLRKRFTWGTTPATFRLQVGNATDEFFWNVVGSNSYGLTDKRRVTALLTLDF
jgi:iron complex outermembrane receptor protein